MASIYKFETRDNRIERMMKDNPGRPAELCAVVVDGIWDNKRKLIESKIPERFRDSSMADLGYMENLVMDSIIEVFDPPSKTNDKIGIVFSGPAGSGKTHAAYAVMHMILDKNPEMIASMLNYSQAFSQIKSEFASGSNDEMGSVWDRLNNDSGMYDGILMIDDVSSQKLTDFEADKLLMFIERRVNSYLPFLFTTNVRPENFKDIFGERIASRLFGYCNMVEFEDRDKRLETNEKTI